LLFTIGCDTIIQSTIIQGGLYEKDEKKKENYDYYFRNFSGIDITACRCTVWDFNRSI
jgi:hypothetical protein